LHKQPDDSFELNLPWGWGGKAHGRFAIGMLTLVIIVALIISAIK